MSTAAPSTLQALSRYGAVRRALLIVGVALLVMTLNVGATVLYMWIYGHTVAPGHPYEFYEAHVQVVAPYLSFIAGAPLMFAACWWLARRYEETDALRVALSVWLVYVSIDLAIVFAVGMTARAAAFCVISHTIKLGGGWAGAALARRRSARGRRAL